MEGNDKKREFKRVIKAAELWQRDNSCRQLLESWLERQTAILASFRILGYEVWSESLEMEWRLTVGLGREGVLETGFTTHRIYGLPIIPGSSLKGLTAAYAHLVKGVEPQSETFHTVFGSQESNRPAAGKVMFLDAIPAQPPKLKLDVMNPHYGEYYQGTSPPANYLDPVPVYFLTVEQTPFRFTLATRDRSANDSLGTTVEWLKEALAEMGTGAKTTAGYGYFGN